MEFQNSPLTEISRRLRYAFDTVILNRRFGSPMGSLRTAEGGKSGSVKSIGKYALVITSSLLFGAALFGATFIVKRSP
jgi:hypothetical protein